MAASPLVRQAELFLAGAILEHRIDLRGAEIGVDHPFAHFRLSGRSFQGIDLSHGRGTLIVDQSQVADLLADRFVFDRASYITSSELTDASFVRAHLRLNVQDTALQTCDFTGSTFAGGFNEYGFRRCRFHRCRFNSIVWRNTYFRACQFHDCTYDGGRLQGSLLSGIKIYGSAPPPAFFSDSDVTTLYQDGLLVPTSAGEA